MALRLAKVPCWTTNAFWPGSRLFLAGYGPLSVQKNGRFHLLHISVISTSARKGGAVLIHSINLCEQRLVTALTSHPSYFSEFSFPAGLYGVLLSLSPCAAAPSSQTKSPPFFFLGGREGLYTGYPLFRHLNCSKVAFLKEWFLRRISFFIDLSRNKHFQLFFSSRDIAHLPT